MIWPIGTEWGYGDHVPSPLTFNPNKDDITSFLRRLDELDTTVKKRENAKMRGAARAISERLVPTVASAVRRSPAPQAGAVAATTKAKSDRMVVVQVGARNPKLSGWRRNGNNRRWRGSVAWGVEKGSYPGTRDEYGIPRSSRGHGIGPALNDISEQVADDYAEVLVEIATSILEG